MATRLTQTLGSAAAEARIRHVQLPDKVSDRLRRLILEGRIPPGQRLVERDLSDLLGVSRTPIREALSQLLREGLVTGRERSGLYVAPLSEGEIVDVYQAIAALERACLLHMGEVAPGTLSGLQAAGRKLASSRGRAQLAIEADSAWHQALTCHSPNGKLQSMLVPLRALSTRYELAFFRDTSNLVHSVQSHERMEQLLKEGDLRSVAALIEEHWLGSIEPMRNAVAAANGADASLPDYSPVRSS